MNRTRLCLLPLLLLATLASCNSTRSEVSRRELRSLDGAIIATSAKARAVIFTGESFAAEPPPDAATSVVSELIASLSASAEETGAGELGLDVGVSRRIAESLTVLGKRSQGISYLRDAGFRLAEARANSLYTLSKHPTEDKDGNLYRTTSILSDKSWESLFRDTLTNARELIMYELKVNPTLSGQGDKAADVPDLFQTVPGVIATAAGAMINVSLLDTSRPNKLVTVEVRGVAHPRASKLTYSTTLDANGAGTITITASDTWTILDLSEPGGPSRRIAVLRQ